MLKAQAFAEYVLCFVAIILAVVAMREYVKRGMAGRYVEVVDGVLSHTSSGGRYFPYYNTANWSEKKIITFTSDVEMGALQGGIYLTNIINETATSNFTINEIYRLNCYD